MTVHQFRRKTDVVRYNRPHTFLIQPVRTHATQYRPNAAAGKKRPPERPIFIHPQPTRNADSQPLRTSYICPLYLLLEEQSVFLFEHVHALTCILGTVGINPFAVIAREIRPATREGVAPHLAFVLTARAHFFPLFKMVRFYQFVQFHSVPPFLRRAYKAQP